MITLKYTKITLLFKEVGLTSSSAAEAMAVEVAKWPSLFGCDGIDLDIENGAGENQVFEEIVVTIS